jgi:hypothetical protein
MKLLDHFIKFRLDLNVNQKLKPLLKDWNINVIVKVLDTEEYYTLIVRKGEILEILEDQVRDPLRNFDIEANNQTLIEIFSGRLSPAEAVLDGELASYGDSKDEDILDVIALIIWGIY